MMAKHFHSNCISVDVQVYKVDFEDGTAWVPEEPPALSDDVNRAGTCRGATASEADVEDLTGYSFVSNSAPDSRNEVQSYSFSCSLEDRGGTAGCLGCARSESDPTVV
jgi:hypothetical protein